MILDRMDCIDDISKLIALTIENCISYYTLNNFCCLNYKFWVPKKINV